MIVYTGAAGYMSDCQAGDLLVAMTAARGAAQLVTLFLAVAAAEWLIPVYRPIQHPRTGSSCRLGRGRGKGRSMAIDLVLRCASLRSSLDPAGMNASHGRRRKSRALVRAAGSVLCYTLVNGQRSPAQIMSSKRGGGCGDWRTKRGHLGRIKFWR